MKVKVKVTLTVSATVVTVQGKVDIYNKHIDVPIKDDKNDVNTWKTI